MGFFSALSEDEGEAVVTDVDRMVQSIGVIFTNTLRGYWLSDADHRQGLRSSFAAVAKVLASCEEITFALMGGTLMVNDKAVTEVTPALQAFTQQLRRIEVDSFVLSRELTEEKFCDLVEVLTTDPAVLEKLGGFSAALAAKGLDGVRAQTLVYQRVAEDEVVVSRQVLEKVADSAGTEFDRLVRALRGQGEGSAADAAQALRNVTAGGGEDLADLLIVAAEESGGGQGDDLGPVSGARLVDGLRRAYDALTQDPAARTQKGKKEIIRILSQVEKALQERMGLLAGDPAAESEKVSAAVGEMMEELKVDALAAEYMKKLKAIEENEKKLLRFMGVRGFERLARTDLKEKLTESGLTPLQWQELLTKSGAGEDRQAREAAFGQLGELLQQMRGTAGSADKPAVGRQEARQISSVAAAVADQVSGMVGLTDRKIAEFVQHLQGDEPPEPAPGPGRKAPRAPSKPGMSRQKLLEVLAEIGQELCQPLAVIACSIDMIRSNRLGEVTETQVSMLQLAADSTEKLNQIVGKLIEIAGVPEGRHPDANIQASLYAT